MSRVRKMLLAFDAPGRWSRQRYERKRDRVHSGSTSIRVSKSTLHALRELARRVDVEMGEDGWHFGSMPLAELLDWLASGIALAPAGELVAACKRAIDEKHASAAAVDARRAG